MRLERALLIIIAVTTACTLAQAPPEGTFPLASLTLSNHFITDVWTFAKARLKKKFTGMYINGASECPLVVQYRTAGGNWIQQANFGNLGFNVVSDSEFEVFANDLTMEIVVPYEVQVGGAILFCQSPFPCTGNLQLTGGLNFVTSMQIQDAYVRQVPRIIVQYANLTLAGGFNLNANAVCEIIVGVISDLIQVPLLGAYGSVSGDFASEVQIFMDVAMSLMWAVGVCQVMLTPGGNSITLLTPSSYYKCDQTTPPLSEFNTPIVDPDFAMVALWSMASPPTWLDGCWNFNLGWIPITIQDPKAGGEFILDLPEVGICAKSVTGEGIYVAFAFQADLAFVPSKAVFQRQVRYGQTEEYRVAAHTARRIQRKIRRLRRAPLYHDVLSAATLGGAGGEGYTFTNYFSLKLLNTALANVAGRLAHRIHKLPSNDGGLLYQVQYCNITHDGPAWSQIGASLTAVIENVTNGTDGSVVTLRVVVPQLNQLTASSSFVVLCDMPLPYAGSYQTTTIGTFEYTMASADPNFELLFTVNASGTNVIRTSGTTLTPTVTFARSHILVNPYVQEYFVNDLVRSIMSDWKYGMDEVQRMLSRVVENLVVSPAGPTAVTFASSSVFTPSSVAVADGDSLLPALTDVIGSLSAPLLQNAGTVVSIGTGTGVDTCVLPVMATCSRQANLPDPLSGCFQLQNCQLCAKEVGGEIYFGAAYDYAFIVPCPNTTTMTMPVPRVPLVPAAPGHADHRRKHHRRFRGAAREHVPSPSAGKDSAFIFGMPLFSKFLFDVNAGSTIDRAIDETVFPETVAPLNSFCQWFMRSTFGFVQRGAQPYAERVIVDVDQGKVFVVVNLNISRVLSSDPNKSFTVTCDVPINNMLNLTQSANGTFQVSVEFAEVPRVTMELSVSRTGKVVAQWVNSTPFTVAASHTYDGATSVFDFAVSAYFNTLLQQEVVSSFKLLQTTFEEAVIDPINTMLASALSSVSNVTIFSASQLVVASGAPVGVSAPTDLGPYEFWLATRQGKAPSVPASVPNTLPQHTNFCADGALVGDWQLTLTKCNSSASVVGDDVVILTRGAWNL